MHFLGVEVDLCDLKSVYRLADRLVNGTIGSPDATTMDGGRLPHGSPGTQSFSGNVQQDRWALSQTPGSTGAQRSWGWGLSGIRIPRLDVVILSAGIGGWVGVDWVPAIRDVLLDTVEAVTYPKFKIPDVGARSKPQSSYLAKMTKDEDSQPLLSEKPESTEPPLGNVFCSNVFGHYILAHELMPLLSRPASSTSKSGGKIVWISSVEGLPENVDLDDIQALKSKTPYEDTKGLIDLMTLTSSLPSVQRVVSSYFDSSKTVSASKSKPSEEETEELPLVRPSIYLTHPGIFCSEIMPLPGILVFFYRLIFIFARWIGSPWHPVDSYKAAVAPTWIALTEPEALENMEGDGLKKAKWGSSTNRSGDERVMKTEVNGWGWTGVVEDTTGKSLGRKRGAVGVTKESREDFEVLGAKCWGEMEKLRETWEGFLGVRDTEVEK